MHGCVARSLMMMIIIIIKIIIILIMTLLVMIMIPSSPALVLFSGAVRWRQLFSHPTRFGHPTRVEWEVWEN